MEEKEKHFEEWIVVKSDLEIIKKGFVICFAKKMSPNLSIRVDGYPRIWFYYSASG